MSLTPLSSSAICTPCRTTFHVALLLLGVFQQVDEGVLSQFRILVITLAKARACVAHRTSHTATFQHHLLMLVGRVNVDPKLPTTSATVLDNGAGRRTWHCRK